MPKERPSFSRSMQKGGDHVIQGWRGDASHVRQIVAPPKNLKQACDAPSDGIEWKQFVQSGDLFLNGFRVRLVEHFLKNGSAEIARTLRMDPEIERTFEKAVRKMVCGEDR